MIWIIAVMPSIIDIFCVAAPDLGAVISHTVHAHREDGPYCDVVRRMYDKVSNNKAGHCAEHRGEIAYLGNRCCACHPSSYFPFVCRLRNRISDDDHKSKIQGLYSQSFMMPIRVLTHWSSMPLLSFPSKTGGVHLGSSTSCRLM